MKLLHCLLLFPNLTFAQTFEHQATVGPVKKTGTYRVELSPDMLGRVQNNFGDIRLYNGQNREVAYYLARLNDQQALTFTPFETVSKQIAPNAQTALTLKQPTPQLIWSLSLKVANTAVQKNATLSGSRDGRTWYAIDNEVRLGNRSTATTATHIETITFPPTDYPFLRLTISDSTSAPLDIQQIGSYDQATTKAQYTPTPGLRFTQRDSSRYTYLFIDRPTPARLDQLTIRVRSPKQYLRQASLGQVISQTVVGKRNRRRYEQSFSALTDFTLTSTGSNTIRLPGILTEKLCLRIANGDNAPLVIERIEAAQISTYLVAELSADSTYQLKFGNLSVNAPNYDVVHFKNELPANWPVVQPGPVVREGPITAETTKPLPAYWLWLGIGGTLLLLGYMSYQMLNGTLRKGP